MASYQNGWSKYIKVLRLPLILAKLMNLRLTAGAVPYGVASQ
nr:MAG TPA: hypothetical protein [Caudoviricetes sp.]